MGKSKGYTMPEELWKILKPIPEDMVRLITLKQLLVRGFWIRPVLESGMQSTCPCCGKLLQREAAFGICSGCYDPAVRCAKFGPALLDHLAQRAEIKTDGGGIVTAENPYPLPPELAAVLRPMSQSEAEKITLKDLMKFWRRPLIKIGQVSECPCCGKVRALKCRGLCGGCNSTKVAKQNLTGPALLEHLAIRAAGDNKISTVTTIKKSTIPASEPSSPAAPHAGAGKVETNEKILAGFEAIAISVAIRKSLGLDSKTPLQDLPQHIDRLIEERGLLKEEIAALVKVAGLRMAEAAELIEEIATLNRLLSTQPIEIPAVTEDAIVAKWSSLPIPDGYDSLSDVLTAAINQAAYGKGLERHADKRPFHEQPIMRETEAVGLGHPAGLARKKILEAVRCCHDHPERAIADLLGAINYTAALVIAIRSVMVEQAA